jgi:hypothetical protein
MHLLHKQPAGGDCMMPATSLCPGRLSTRQLQIWKLRSELDGHFVRRSPLPAGTAVSSLRLAHRPSQRASVDEVFMNVGAGLAATNMYI